MPKLGAPTDGPRVPVSMRFNELQVRPPNRSRTGAESALRVNSKHEYRENCALKFGVCFRPKADRGALSKRT